MYRAAVQQMVHLSVHWLDNDSLTALSTSDIFEQGPWNRRPKSRAREVVDHMEGSGPEFERAHWAMVEDARGSASCAGRPHHHELGQSGPQRATPTGYRMVLSDLGHGGLTQHVAPEQCQRHGDQGQGLAFTCLTRGGQFLDHHDAGADLDEAVEAGRDESDR